MKDNLRMFIVSKLSIGIRVEGGGQGGLQPPPPQPWKLRHFSRKTLMIWATTLEREHYSRTSITCPSVIRISRLSGLFL